MDGAPGFTKKVLVSLGQKMEAATLKGENVLYLLTIDDMSIKKQIEWNGEHVVGYVDMGTVNTDDSSPVATEAHFIIFMCVNGS